MVLVTENIRRVEKRSTVAGEIPTVAPSNDHTDGSWVVTDIYEGELFINVTDKASYTRVGAEIICIGEVALTDAGVISTITDSGNWDVDGNYTGVTTGLLQGHVHYNDAENLKYEFDGTTLRRITYNSEI